MKEIVADSEKVAYCGLYCGSCRAHLKGKCPTCKKKKKATWCKIRECCMENSYSSCADCKEFNDPKECKKFHNFFSKVISFFLRSDRCACINQIKDIGIEKHAEKMASDKIVTLKP